MSANVSVAASVEAFDYKLGPQDKLEIKVFDLRPGSVDIHQWDAFHGDVAVDALGRVSLPLIGTVVAQDLTVGQLAETVAARIQQKAGLLQAPSATVQVSRYRPFYVTGEVDSSGEYEYRPGLNVLQALSIAGGPRRMKEEDVTALRKEEVIQQGELRALTSEQMHSIVKQARLSAEINNLPGVNLPETVLNYKDSSELQKAIQDERNYFDLRLSLERGQIASYEGAKKNISDQLLLLSVKDSTLSKQVELVSKDLDVVKQLVAKGLSVSTREISAAQSVASYESSKLDVQLAAIRAQEELSRMDREISEIRSKRRNESLREMQDLRSKISGSREKIQTSETLLNNLSKNDPATISNGIHILSYTISRKSSGGTESFKADANSLIFPGDVLVVSQGDNQLSANVPDRSYSKKTQ